MARKKPLPRTLKEPEEILTLAQQVRKFLAPYRKWLLGGGLLLLTVLAGWAGYRSYSAYMEGKAQEALERLRPRLAQEETSDEVRNGLAALIRDYPGTRAAWLAKAYLGHLLYRQGKYREAARTYEELVLAVDQLRDTGWNPFIIESLSFCYEALGEYRRAADTLKPLAEVAPGPQKNLLLSRLALLYEKAGQPEEARLYWERLLAASPSGVLGGYVREKLSDLRGAGAATPSSP